MQRGLSGMSSNLDDFMKWSWPAIFNFATTVFLFFVKWFVVFLARSSRKQLATDFIIWLIRCSPILPFILSPANTCGGARNNFKVQRAGISNSSGSTCKPLFAKPYEILFTTVGRPRLPKRTSGFVSQSALPGFG